MRSTCQLGALKAGALAALAARNQVMRKTKRLAREVVACGIAVRLPPKCIALAPEMVSM